MTDLTASDHDTGFVGLLDRAQQVGRWIWIERTIFELFGGWAGSCGDDVLDGWFGEMSRRHGWHAEVLFDRLPELSILEVDELVQSPGPGTDALFALLDPPGQGSVGPGRVSGAYEVLLPALIRQYRQAQETMSPIAEPSLIRWTEVLLRDDLDEQATGDDLVRSALSGAEEEEASLNGHRSQLVRALRDSGGLSV